MIPTPDRQFAHARAVRARGGAMPADGVPSADILDSWVRCMERGMESGAALRLPVAVAAELRLRRERAEVVRRLARAELDVLAQQIAGSNFLLAFADHEGVILDLYADNRFKMSGSGADIVAGSCWSESLVGTNGLGTVLATGRSLAVTGLEHYNLQLGDISCTAAPVRDAQGRIVGVLDAASYFESRQRHTQALVQMAATHIENGLLVHQMRAKVVLAIHPRPEFLGTLSAGLAAFDDDGRLMAMNARCSQLLHGIAMEAGTAFETIFGEPFDQVLAQLALQPEVRLRDRLGSALVATCVNRPPRPRPHLISARLDAPNPAALTTISAPPPASTHDQTEGDAAVREAYRLVDAAVRMRVPILIQGETGSGKELLARHAHAVAGRSGSFVAVNCGALPAELVEAELFGHVGGAFTCARREGSIGLIASADGGSLLLDEVGELPLRLQATLLRFLDDQTVRPVGGTTTRRVDVQLLAATHAELDDEVTAKRFRADLLYRLNTVRVELPPLRRRSDFNVAACAMLAAIDEQAIISAEALARLAQHAWPGNFRELRAMLTRALLWRGEHRIDRVDIDHVLPGAPPASTSALQLSASELIRREFERSGRSVTRTARTLGVSRTTVYRHLREGR